MKHILVAILLLPCLARAQNWAAVSASNITDLNQQKLGSGQLCFLATDQSDTPISFSAGGGGQVLRRAFCATVTNGAVAAFTVPNPAASLPSGIYYRVTVKDSATGQEVLRYPQVTFSGGTFNFDAYAPPSGVAFAPLSGNAVSGNLSVTGNVSVTGSLSAGSISAPNVVSTTPAGTQTIAQPAGSALAVANGTVTNSSISNAAFHVSRTDNSPPASGAGILNAYLAPMVRFDLLSQSGAVTGSHAGLLVNMPGVKGKAFATTTQAITASGSPQTVSVSDSSIFVTGETALIDAFAPNQESVAVTAIPDGTHVTGTFAKNHANGINVTVFSKGDKIGMGISMGEQSGNTDSVWAMNPNVTCTSALYHPCSIAEFDITNNAAAPVWPSQTGGPVVQGVNLIASGSFNSLYGFRAAPSSSARFLNGFVSGSALNQAFLVENEGNGSPVYGLNIASATTAGVLIGSNQTTPSDPSFVLADPGDGIFLTAQGSGISTVSNTLAFQERQTNSNHVGRFQLSNAQLRYTYDSAWNGIAFDSDGGISTQFKFRIRNSGNTEIAHWDNQAGTPVLTNTVYVTTSPNPATVGAIRFATADAVMQRNAANTANLNVWSKDSSDAFQFGDTGGVKLASSSSTPIRKHFSVTASLAFAAPSSVPGCAADMSITLPGAALGDSVALGIPGPPISGQQAFSWVDSVNTVKIRWCQFSGSAATPTSGTYRVDDWQH